MKILAMHWSENSVLNEKGGNRKGNRASRRWSIEDNYLTNLNTETLVDIRRESHEEEIL
jgi:hypothetical protein